MKYVAFLRGIGPGNPNMHQSKLCGVLESLGFTEVQGVVSSGNVVFESPRTDMGAMEAEMEAAWPEKLGFKSLTLVRSQKQLQAIVDNHPYGEMQHNNSGTYLLITFFKRPTRMPFTLPYQPDSKPFELLSATSNYLYTVTDNTILKTPDLMTWLERQFTKDLSSRTLLTVQRILKKMQA